MMRRRWLVGLTEYAGVTRYTGGIGTHYASLLPALVRAGIEIDLALFDKESLLMRQAPGGVRIIAHRRLRSVPLTVLPLVRAVDFRAIAASVDYDCVLMPEWGGLAALLPRRAPLVTNLATSMRLATEISGVSPSSLPTARRCVAAVQDWCESRQIGRSRGVVPISRAMADRNRQLLGGLPRAVVVPNCIDVADVQETATSPARPLPDGWPDGDAPIVLFLGRLERRKGVLEAAQAFGAVADRHPAVRFVFAGAPGDSRFEPTREELLQRVGAPERTVLLGHVPSEQLFRAIGCADVVVCPSRWEGFGQVALEAKAIGRPLVVTSGSGFDDFCIDGIDSLVVAPGESRALAGAVDRLLQDPELAAALAKRARSGVDRFTADAVAPQLIAAVESMAGRLTNG